MLIVIVVIIGSLLIFWSIYLMWAATDRLQPYANKLQLQKAALAYSGDLHALQQTILPSRKSVFTFGADPVIWIYEESAPDVALFLTSYKHDVRIWFQPKTVLTGVHIVLDSIANNHHLSNLELLHRPPQEVTLEGDFSQHFKLYCGKEQQVIALQIIAPDMMAFLIDTALDADVEIIDNQISVIVRGGAKSLQTVTDTITFASHMHRLAVAAGAVTTL